MNYNTNFKLDLENKFKEKNISNTSIKTYLRNLEKLNDDMPLKNLNFLSNVDEILNKLSNYKPNTYRNYIISICSALHLDTSKKGEKLYKIYYDKLININKELKEKEKEGERTETQKNNWISWNDVLKIHQNLKNEIEKFKNSKEINQHKYNILLEYVILSLYVYVSPKRNQDWSLMLITKKFNDNSSIESNYYDISNETFIFNKYKTSKTNGELIEKVPPELIEVLKTYLKFHPIIRGNLKNVNNTPLLVYYNGENMRSVNSITRILNKIFKKKIGSSMLRNIYLTSKYGENLQEMKKDAKIMGHSLETQHNNYIKTK